MAIHKNKTMKKNKVPFPVLLANVLVLVAVLGLSYMWLCSRGDALGKEIKQKEVELVSAQKRLVNEQDLWSTITSPANLQRAIHKHQLGMIMPREKRIVRVGRWSKDSGRVAMVRHRP